MTLTVAKAGSLNEATLNAPAVWVAMKATGDTSSTV